jgi:hypothetical protein
MSSASPTRVPGASTGARPGEELCEVRVDLLAVTHLGTVGAADVR